MTIERKSLPLHTKIFIGLILGAILGGITQAILKTSLDAASRDAALHFIKDWIRPFGELFLRLIFMIVVPLLFSALVLGVADIGDARRVGRIGLRCLMMTVLLSGTAVLLGILLVNIVKPGAGVNQERRDQLVQMYASKNTKDAEKKVQQGKEAKSVSDTLLEIVPKNPLEEAVRALDGGILPLMFFALFFGIAMSFVEAEKAAPVKSFLEGMFAISMKVIEIAMRYAPIGVFALVFTMATQIGIDEILALIKYVLLVLFALAFHQFITYSLALKYIAKRDPRQFFSQIREVMITAFATSSSNATLPVAMRVAEEKVGLPRDISNFVLTVGATANQNGTALFEGVTIIFLAQFFGVSLDIGQQFMVMGLAILAGVGTAGVPGGAWPMIAIILTSIGVPAAPALGLCLGIDRILDMSRTVLNVSGDITIAACVSQMEGNKSDFAVEAAI